MKQPNPTKTKPVERPVFPEYKYSITIESFKRFSWKQRLQILLGYNATAMVTIVSVNSMGKAAAKMDLNLTKLLAASDAVKEKEVKE